MVPRPAGFDLLVLSPIIAGMPEGTGGILFHERCYADPERHRRAEFTRNLGKSGLAASKKLVDAIQEVKEKKSSLGKG
jgi:hypothetical protein